MLSDIAQSMSVLQLHVSILFLFIPQSVKMLQMLNRKCIKCLVSEIPSELMYVFGRILMHYQKPSVATFILKARQKAEQCDFGYFSHSDHDNNCQRPQKGGARTD